MGRRRPAAAPGQRRPRGDMRMQGGRPARLVRGARAAPRWTARWCRWPMLLAAIREERRYVRVGARGFVRIEETLRAGAGAAPRRAFFEYRGTLQLAGGGQRSAGGAGRGRGADRGQRGVHGPAPAHARRAPARSPQLPAGAGGGAAPLPEGGRRLDGAPGALGGGGDPGRRDGPGQDRADAGAAGCTGRRSGPALVVAPTSVVPNWVDEAARFAPELKVRLYRGTERAAAAARPGPGRPAWSPATPSPPWTPRRCGAHRLRVAGAGRGPGGEERHHRAGQGAARAATPAGGWG